MGFATNDRFEVVRRGEPPDDAAQRFRTQREVTSYLKRSTRQREHPVTEGALVVAGVGPSQRGRSCGLARGQLLNRYGIVSRELAAMDAAAPAWRILYEVLSRMEMAGEARRGYFVEGLSEPSSRCPKLPGSCRSCPCQPSRNRRWFCCTASTRLLTSTAARSLSTRQRALTTASDSLSSSGVPAIGLYNYG